MTRESKTQEIVYYKNETIMNPLSVLIDLLDNAKAIKPPEHPDMEEEYADSLTVSKDIKIKIIKLKKR